MEQLIEWLKEYDYAMAMVGMVFLIWLVWIPRIVAPVLIPRYDKFPPSLKAAVNLLLPTIEKAMLDGWDTLYTEVVKEIVDTTETELDDRIFEEVDKQIHKRLNNKSLGYFPQDETIEQN